MEAKFIWDLVRFILPIFFVLLVITLNVTKIKEYFKTRRETKRRNEELRAEAYLLNTGAPYKKRRVRKQ
jgi:hypothetical protein